MIKFWQRWLMVLADVFVLFGIAMIFLGGGAAFAPIDQPTFAAFFGADVPAAALDYHRFLFALNGAVTAGWGVMIFFLAWQPFGRGERWAWWALAVSATVWFVLDTAVALSFGAYAYAVFNVAVIVAVDIPLLATARHFLGERRQLAAA
ncbi:MAG: hypothetical protein RIM84_08235 [Alphaproteobacteria bacterium]